MTRLSAILSLLSILLVGCGMSQDERENLAAVTCSIIGETRNMDSAIRVEKVNDARKELSEDPFLDGDVVIKESFEYGLCVPLVLNDPAYDSMLEDEREKERLINAEYQRREEQRRAEQREKEAAIAAERMRLEQERIDAELEVKNMILSNMRSNRGKYLAKCGSKFVGISLDEKKFTCALGSKEKAKGEYDCDMKEIQISKSEISWVTGEQKTIFYNEVVTRQETWEISLEIPLKIRSQVLPIVGRETRNKFELCEII